MNPQAHAFNLPSDFTYLNCAYMAPQLRAVTEAGMQAIGRKENPISISPSDFFKDTETLRQELAALIDTPHPERIVTVPSVSYGMANVARNIRLERGQKIIVTEGQFPSNVYPWHRLAGEHGAEVVTVAAPAIEAGRGEKWNTAILESIDQHTRLVALGHVHWADGTLFDLQAIRQRTREVGALMVIDGTQSVGALPFSVAQLEPDALVCAGYKWLLGPYALGMAYYGPAFDGGVPVEENWINRYQSEDFKGLTNYNAQYQPGALRYEVGERSNFILVPMFLAAIRQINAWGVAEIQSYMRQLTEEPMAQLREMGFFVESSAFRGGHLIGIGMPAGKNLAVLHDLLLAEKIQVSFRGDFVRIAPHLYNTPEDMEKLVGVMQKLLAR
jgi:selenocysteine lyase/cysteine desulfurase